MPLGSSSHRRPAWNPLNVTSVFSSRCHTLLWITTSRSLQKWALQKISCAAIAREEIFKQLPASFVALIQQRHCRTPSRLLLAVSPAGNRIVRSQHLFHEFLLPWGSDFWAHMAGAGVQKYSL